MENYIHKSILNICSKEYPYFLNKSNVLGVGCGYKISNGYCTCQKCIKVFVSKKVPSNELCINDMVPNFYKGLPTDIVQSGRIKACSLTSRIRPAISGYSISPIVNYEPSTFACVVKDNKSNYILGTSHALACLNRLPLQAPILQPAIQDGGRNPQDVIATLAKFIKLKFETLLTSPKNYVDCALAKIVDSTKVSPNIAILGKVKGVHPAILGSEAKKVGRTSALTTGLIISTGLSITVDFEDESCLFKDQIATTKMAESGDSGSLMMDRYNFATGLLFATSESGTFYNPIGTVLNTLGVTIVK